MIVIFIIVATICYAKDSIYQYIDADGNLVISNKPKHLKSSSNRRFQILQNELIKEREALKNTTDLLTQNSQAGGKEQEAINKVLKDSILEHQKNIEILNKQLGFSPK